MSNSQLQHWKDLKDEHLKRLRVLELQSAQFGAQTPPHIKIEMAQLEETLRDLELKLSLSAENYLDTRNFAIIKYRKIIEVEFTGPYSPEILAAIIRAIAALVATPADQIKLTQIIGVGEKYRMELPINTEALSTEIARLIQRLGGNIVYKFDLPASSADQFLRLYQRNDDHLIDMGVQSVNQVKTQDQPHLPVISKSGVYIPIYAFWVILFLMLIFFAMTINGILAFLFAG